MNVAGYRRNARSCRGDDIYIAQVYRGLKVHHLRVRDFCLTWPREAVQRFDAELGVYLQVLQIKCCTPCGEFERFSSSIENRISTRVLLTLNPQVLHQQYICVLDIIEDTL